METIPFIQLKKHQIITKQEENILSLKEIREQIEKGKNIYMQDDDGVYSNKPNYDIYQHLSEDYTLWIDAGFRIIDDVVDSVMEGASVIILRRNTWLRNDISEIQELTECQVYTAFHLNNRESNMLDLATIPGSDGAIIFIEKTRDGETDELVKKLCSTYKTYVADVDDENATYWDSIGAHGLLIPFNKRRKEILEP